jgi:transcriptional regulator with XRE-family HTH domain
MTGTALRTARQAAFYTQAQAAACLGVTQAYLSMLEHGRRAIPADLAKRAVEKLAAPVTSLPLPSYQLQTHEPGFFQTQLGSLGYPGFAYLQSARHVNPAELLMAALDENDLDARVTEALAWLPLTYPSMDWSWLEVNARLCNRQNRLGYVVELARQAAIRTEREQLAAEITAHLASLETSRLANEGTLCRDSMTRTERAWLQSHRPPAAMHWNLLTDLTVEQLVYAA